MSAARYRFFGGKGGAGKTTCAAAAAVAAAERGRRVLVVSTDPAHSLGDAFVARLGAVPRRLATRCGALHAVELDADRALERWLGPRRRMLRTIATRGTYLDEDDVERLLALSMPGVDELVGLVELARLGRDRPYDEVVVDTAPTGHTLRLLAMPETLRRMAGVLADMQAKHRFLADRLGGGHRVDAGDALVDEIDAEGHALAGLLRDPARVTFTWVLRPEVLALEESRDAIHALERTGITVSDVVVNGLTPAAAAHCTVCQARGRAERTVMVAIRRDLHGRRLRVVPALAGEPRGVAALRRVARAMAAAPPRVGRPAPAPRRVTARAPATAATVPAAPDAGLDDLLAPPGVRLLLFGGKGGVGKTTCAARTALALAARRPRQRILLLSTDPAHSLGDVLGLPLGDDERPVPGAGPGLRARELDAEREFGARRDRYRAAVDALFDALLRGSRFDVAFDREVVHRLIDLAPPGLDELFAILAVIQAVVHPSGEPYDLVVVDTAPTGHALRLLSMPAAALEWVRALLAILLKYRSLVGLGELAADLVAASRDLRALAALLADAGRARFVPVARPGALPELETVRLLRALSRLHLDAPVAIVNAVTRGAGVPRCPRCAADARGQARSIAVIQSAGRRRGRARVTLVLAPALPDPPRGVDSLLAWGRTWTRTPS